MAKVGEKKMRSSKTKILGLSNSFTSTKKDVEIKNSRSFEMIKERDDTVWGSIWPIWTEDLKNLRSKSKSPGKAPHNKCNINALGFSPDGTVMISGGTDSILRIHQVATGEFVEITDCFDGGAIVDVSFSSCGNFLCAATRDSLFVLNDDGKEEWSASVDSSIYSVAFSPDNKTLAVGCSIHTSKDICIYDYHTGERLYSVGDRSDYPLGTFCDLSFSPDGSWLACAGNNLGTGKDAKTITVIQMHPAAGAPPGTKKKIYEYDQVIECVSFSNQVMETTASDDHSVKVLWLAAGGHDGIIIRNFYTGNVLMAFAHEGGVTSICWSLDGKYFSAGDADFIVDKHNSRKHIPCKAWTTVRDISTGGVVAHYEHSNTVRCQDFCGTNGNILVTADGSKITARDFVTGDIENKFMHNKRILHHGVSLSNNSSVVCIGDTNNVFLRDMKTGRKLHKWKFPKSDSIHGVNLSSDGKYVAVCTTSKKVIIYETLDASPLHEFIRDTEVTVVRFSPDSKALAFGDKSGNVHIHWMGGQGVPLRICKLPGRITSLAISPKCDQIGVTFDDDGTQQGDHTAYCYDIDNRDEEDNLVASFSDTDTIVDIEYSRDGLLVAIGGNSKFTRIYDRASETLLHSFKHEERVLAVAFSGDSKMIASCDFAGLITVYSKAGEIVAIYTEKKPPHTIAWSSDSKYIATGNHVMKGSSVKIRLSPIVWVPQKVESTWVGLMREHPYLWRLPRASDDKNSEIISTPLNDISSLELESLLKDNACSMKFGNMSRILENPRCVRKDEVSLVTPLDMALHEEDHRRCRLLAGLVDIACDDSDATFSEWISKLPGKNDALLIEILKKSILPTENVVFSDRVNMPTESLILPCEALNPRWTEKRREEDMCKTRRQIRAREEEVRARSKKKRKHSEDHSGFLFSEALIHNRFRMKKSKDIKYRSVETLAVGPPHFIKHAFENIVNESSVAVFETPVMKYTVDYLWSKVKGFYYVQVTLYSLLVVFFSIGHFFNLDNIKNPDDSERTMQRWIAGIAFYMSLVLGLFFLLQEGRQMCHTGAVSYIDGGWNILELGSYIATILSVIWIELKLPLQNVVGAVAMMWIWIGMLSHLRGISMFGGIIATFVQILIDIGGFMGVMAVFWIGGAMSFKVLLPGSPDFAYFNALLSVWYMILGDPIPDAFVVEGTQSDPNSTSLHYGIYGISTESQALWTQITAQVLSTGFVFIIMIVLLNQLIALMGDSYSKVMNDYDVQTRRSRAKVIVSLVTLYGNMVRDRDNTLQPRWLHVLRPLNKGMSGRSGGNWEGNLKAIKKDIASSRKEMNVKITQTEVELTEKLERMSKKFSSQTAEILKRLQYLGKRRITPA